MNTENMAVVHIDEHGCYTFHFSGDVRLITIDERAPNDRVYEITDRDDPETLRQMIGESEIGNKDDARHPAIANRIRSALDGKPHLSPVEN